MVSFNIFRDLALSFPEVNEVPHFEKISFRVNKKIFATYDEKNHRACVKLSEIDQDVFSSMGDRAIIFPLNNKWGKQGWTIVELTNIHKDVFVDVLTTAYCEVAPKKFGKIVRPDLDDY